MTPTPAVPAAPTDPAADKARRAALLVVFVVVFIDLLGFGIVLPLLPRIAEGHLRDLPPAAKGAVIGLLYSSFSLMQFVLSPVWGRVSDRYGRRPVLLLGLAGSVLFYALFGWASMIPADDPNLATVALFLLLLSRVGAGAAGATVGTAAAVIADSTPPEKRARGMALIGAAFGIGFTFGPLIAYAGLELFAKALWAPGFLASSLSGVALVLGFLLLPETLPAGPKPPRSFFSLSRTVDVLRTPAVGPLVLIYFLAIFAFANFEGTLSLFTGSAFGLDDTDNFLVFAYIGFVLMVAQGGVYRPLAGRRSEQDLMTLGVGLMLLGLGGLAGVAYGAHLTRPAPLPGGEVVSVTGVVGLKPLFYLAVTVAVFGFAFVNPSISALVSRRADPARQGEVLGVNQGCSALGRILGPLVGSVAFYLSDTRTLPFAVAVAVLLGVFALLPMVKQNEDFTAEGAQGAEKNRAAG